VTVKAHGAAFAERAPGRRTLDRLEHAARAVGVKRAYNAEIAGAVKASIARAVSNCVASGKASGVKRARKRRLRNGVSWTVKVHRTQNALRVKTVVSVAHSAGVVVVLSRRACLALLADYVARGGALLLHKEARRRCLSILAYLGTRMTCYLCGSVRKARNAHLTADAVVRVRLPRLADGTGHAQLAL